MEEGHIMHIMTHGVSHIIIIEPHEMATWSDHDSVLVSLNLLVELGASFLAFLYTGDSLGEGSRHSSGATCKMRRETCIVQNKWHVAKNVSYALHMDVPLSWQW